MAVNLAGKVALITGGAQGLGRAFAERLLARGARVSLLDVNRHVGQSTENELRQQHGSQSTLFVPCDVSDKEQLEAAFQATQKTFGGLDIVVNNAGIGDEINWEKTVAINLTAVIKGSYLGMKAMRKDEGGRGGLIVNVASLAGLTPPPLCSVYTGTKFGVVGFSRSLAETFPIDIIGVKVTCLCPSFAKTEIMDNIRGAMDNLKPGVLKDAAEKLELMTHVIGEMETSDVSSAFMRLVDDERAHGGVLLVTPRGQEYKFPKQIAGKL